MYRHPSNPDPWAEVQEIPPYQPAHDEGDDYPSGAFAGAVGVLIVAAGFFSLGYMSGLWGWF